MPNRQLDEFKVHFDAYLNAAINGTSCDAVGTVTKARALSINVRSKYLSTFLHDVATEKSACAACFMLAVGVDEPAHIAAVEHLANVLKKHDELAGGTWSMLSGTENLPEELIPIMKQALSSKDESLRLMAAMSGIRIAEVAPQSHWVLSEALRSENKVAQQFAGVALAKAGVRKRDSERFLLEALNGDQNEIKLMVIAQLDESLERSPAVVAALRTIARDRNQAVPIRASAFRVIGKTAPRCLQTQAMLVKSLLEVKDDWRLWMAISLGLVNQSLTIPREAIDRLLQTLHTDNLEFKLAASTLLMEGSDSLDDSDLEQVGNVLQDEVDEGVQEKLIRCLIALGPLSIRPVIALFESANAVRRLLYLGILSELCAKWPEDVAVCFFEHEDRERLEEVLPFILAGARSISPLFDDWVDASLRSGDEEECALALFALTSVEELADNLLQPLLDVFLNANETNYLKAKSILVRVGPRLRSHLTSLSSEASKQGESRLKDLRESIGLGSNTGRERFEIILEQIAQPDLIRHFVTIGDYIEREGSCSYRRLTSVIDKSASSVRIMYDDFNALLKSKLDKGSDFNLLAGKSNQPQTLTQDGQTWLRHCREYLQRLDRDC